MNKETILHYLGMLENGALNYYQTIETIRIAGQSIQNYIIHLERQCKKQKEVIDKIKRHCEIEINASNHYLKNHSSQQELCHKVAHQRILDILKGVSE